MHVVCHHLKYSTEKKRLNAKKTSGPSLLTYGETASGFTVGLPGIRVWAIVHKAGLNICPPETSISLLFVCNPKQKSKALLRAYCGSFHPFSDGHKIKAFNWEVKEMNSLLLKD